MENKITGFILINKPAGITSHDAVDQLRKITGIKKIGHAGTLDPFATGLLILAIGRQATKQIDHFVKLDKEYIAKLKFGAISDTYDKTGKITLEQCDPIKISAIKKVLKKFTGQLQQIPPMYSAKKINGKKLYQLARQGKEIKRQPSQIIIYNIELLGYEWPFLELKIKCSSGTYIRSLAHDIGQQLNCGAYLEELKRIKIGKYNIDNAHKIENLTMKNINSYIFGTDLT